MRISSGPAPRERPLSGQDVVKPGLEGPSGAAWYRRAPVGIDQDRDKILIRGKGQRQG